MKTLVRNNFVPAARINTFPSLFNSIFNELETVSKPTFGGTLPSVNVIESEDNFTVQLAAPGLKREDFKVNVHEDVLTISSEQKTENEEKKENFTRREFSYSSFTRSFNLPETVDSDAIAATYTDGILQLVLPKKEEAKPKEPKLIEVA